MINVQMEVNLTEAEQRLNFTPEKNHLLAVAALRGMNRYVPIDTGKLRGGAYVETDEVVYSRGVEYAGYVYNMPQAWIKTPGTYANWPQAYVDAGAPEVVEEVERIVSDK